MSGARRLLLVEDDPVMGGSLVQRFNLEGFNVSWCKTGSEGLAALKRFRPHVVISDIRLPDISGEDLLGDVIVSTAGANVFFITAFADLEQAVRLVRAGAADYIQKPFSVDKLSDRLRKLFQRIEADGASQPGVLAPFELSPVMRSIGETLRRVADTDVPVLLLGETGVGKDVAAHFLHDSGRRRQAPFVPVNCGAIPPDLIESAVLPHQLIQQADVDIIADSHGENAGVGRVGRSSVGEDHAFVGLADGRQAVGEEQNVLRALVGRSRSDRSYSFRQSIVDVGGPRGGDAVDHSQGLIDILFLVSHQPR